MQIACCSHQLDDVLVSFGKHRGRSIQQVNDGYLHWMLRSFSESSPWHKAAAEALTARGKRDVSPDVTQAHRRQREADVHALLADLKSCSLKRDLHWGRTIHARAVASGHESNIYVATTLIKMYAKCGCMADARQVFDGIRKPNVVSWTMLLSGYAENGEEHVTLEMFSKMKADGYAPNSVTYVAVLKACIALAANGDESSKAQGLEIGKEIHSQMGEHLDLYLRSMLIDMYAKFGNMVTARQVFDSILKPDVVSWTALLLGYVDNGESAISLELFFKMKHDGCAPDSVTYIAALKACASLAINGDGNGKAQGLEMGRTIHLQISSDHLDCYVQSTLIDMYAKCGSMAEARKMFDTIRKPGIVSWNALLLGYVEHGEGHLALELFFKMKASSRCKPDYVTYIAALKACTSLAENEDASGKAHVLQTGSKIHAELGDHLNLHLQSTLIDMYANCCSMADARQVFDSIRKPDVVSWSALLLGYANNGEGHAALELFSKMKSDGCAPSNVTYIALLKACGLIGDLSLGRKFHSDISEFTVSMVTSLVDFYAKCGSMGEARAVFDVHLKGADIARWNALLAGYGSCGDIGAVFSVFEVMQDMGFQPNGVTFLTVLLCCSHAGLVDKARENFEAMSLRYGIAPTVMHCTCMVDALGRANQLLEALSVLRRMPCNPNAVTWNALLGACRKWKKLELGQMAFESLVDMNKEDASPYVLMRGMWEVKLS